MAEFCTKCVVEKIGANTKPDIDIYEIAKNDLQPGTYTPVLCEGCGMVAVGVGEDEKIMLAYPSGETSENPEEILVEWIYIEEYENNQNKNQ